MNQYQYVVQLKDWKYLSSVFSTTNSFDEEMNVLHNYMAKRKFIQIDNYIFNVEAIMFIRIDIMGNKE